MAYGLLTRRAFILGGSMALLSYSFFETNMLTTKRYKVLIENLPPALEGFTILHLSDLHSEWFGEGQSQLLALIRQQKYDMVAITGDFVDIDNPKIGPGLTLAKALIDKPVYFVPGNHDYGSGYQIREPLLKLGVHILENRAEKLTFGSQELWIIGVDEPYLGKDDLIKALQVTDGKSPKILLAHAPNIYSKAISEKIDLVLVGHTHGGQVRVPLLGAIVAPGQGFFPKFDYGLYKTGRTSMIITSGLGTSTLPIRFNSKPEIVFVTLARGGSDEKQD